MLTKFKKKSRMDSRVKKNKDKIFSPGGKNTDTDNSLTPLPK